MYDVIINGRTSDGERLGTVHLRGRPGDIDKLIRLRERMMVNGWQGRPVILLANGDHHLAFTGCHRLAAVAGLEGVEVEAVMLPTDLTAEQWEEIEDANDDLDLLRAFEAVAEERDDMAEVVAAMQAEIEAS